MVRQAAIGGPRRYFTMRGLILFMLLASAALISACGGGGSSSPEMPTAAPSQAFSLTVSTSGNGSVTSSPGGIACGSTCMAAFSPGSQVTLQAMPAAGDLFTGWSGACSGSAATCTVTMLQAQSVSASFSTQPEGVAVVGGQLQCQPGDEVADFCNIAGMPRRQALEPHR